GPVNEARRGGARLGDDVGRGDYEAVGGDHDAGARAGVPHACPVDAKAGHGGEDALGDRHDRGRVRVEGLALGGRGSRHSVTTLPSNERAKHGQGLTPPDLPTRWGGDRLLAYEFFTSG